MCIHSVVVFVQLYFLSEQFKEYLEQAKMNNEMEELRLFKLIIFGPPRVGKSSLFQVLVNKEPKQVSRSTGVFNRQLFKVAITQDGTECISEWDIITIQNEISRLQGVLEKKRKSAEKIHKLEEKSKLEGTPSLPPTKVENEMIKQYDKPDLLPSATKYTTALMVCYDSGGQPEFFDIMPALATNPTGYIMVFDMSKDLDSPNEYKVVINDKEYSARSKISSIQMMKGAIAGIQSHCSNDQMLIVGTHLKEYLSAGRNLGEIDKHIYKNIVRDKVASFVRKRQEEKQSRYIYPINNQINNQIEYDDRACVAQEIRTAVEKMSENENIHAEIPINWHLFQLEIQLEIESTPKKNYISLATCIEYAKQCGIDHSKIDVILEYFHTLGIILYYGKTVTNVVFSPQWLFDRLSDIIFLKYSCENWDYDVQENIEKGIIERKTFQQMYQDKIDSDGPLKLDQLLEIFAGQNIIAKFPDKVEKFFIPALLNPTPPDVKHIPTEYGKKVYKTLYVKCGEQYFPRVIFCCLATHFMEKGWNIQHKNCYRDRMIFQAPHGEYFVCLLDNITELAVEIYHNKSNKSIPVSKISRLLNSFMIKFCNEINISSNFKFGFTCNQTNCTHFAFVELQYPYLIEKFCEECSRSSKLQFDEMAWLISIEDVCDILKIKNPQVCNTVILLPFFLI